MPVNVAATPTMGNKSGSGTGTGIVSLSATASAGTISSAAETGGTAVTGSSS
jgi:hypothetical protein